MRALLFALLAVVACGDNKEPASLTPDGPGPVDAPTDSPTVGPLTPCLDRPTNLDQPSATLPCELLPPGFTAQ